MPLFPSLPEPAHLMDLFARFPDNVRPLLDYSDGLLRGEGTGVNLDYAQAPEGHPAASSTPDAQAQSYRQFGERVAAMAKG